MNLSRRAFLGVLTAATAAAVASPAVLTALELDPERLLWTPGAKTFFLPTLATGPALRAATEQEISDLLGIARVRVRHIGDLGREEITVISEKAYAMTAHLFHGVTEVHFANGGVAYATGPMTLEAARARAEAQLAINGEYLARRAATAARLRQARQDPYRCSREQAAEWGKTFEAGAQKPTRRRRA